MKISAFTSTDTRLAGTITAGLILFVGLACLLPILWVAVPIAGIYGVVRFILSVFKEDREFKAKMERWSK